MLKHFVGSVFDNLYLAICQTFRFTDELYLKGIPLLNWVMMCVMDNSNVSKCMAAILKDFSPCTKYYQSIRNYKMLPLYVDSLENVSRVFEHVKIVHALFHTGRTGSVLFNVSKELVKAEVQKYMDRINLEDVKELKQMFEVFNSVHITQFDLRHFKIKGQLIVSSYSFSGIAKRCGLSLLDYPNVFIVGDVSRFLSLSCNNVTVYGNVKGSIFSNARIRVFGSVEAEAKIVHKGNRGSRGKGPDSEVIIRGNIMKFASISVFNSVLECYGDVKGGTIETVTSGLIIKGDILGGHIDCRNGVYVYVHSGANKGRFCLKGIPYVFFDKSVVINYIDASHCEFYFKENVVFKLNTDRCVQCGFRNYIDKKVKKFDIPKFRALMEEKLVRYSAVHRGQESLQFGGAPVHSALNSLSGTRGVQGNSIKVLKIKSLSDLKAI
ncbi:MAG: hypothetical protein ACTJLM_03730 [Ehrlichia sp.]